MNATEDPLSQLGAKVARKRNALDLSQEELLGEMRLTPYRPDVTRQSHISNIETSTGDKLPSVRALAALAIALKTSTDYLVGLTDDDTRSSPRDGLLTLSVRDEDERQLLRGLYDLIHGLPREEQRFLSDVVRRLVGSSQPIVIGKESDS